MRKLLLVLIGLACASSSFGQVFRMYTSYHTTSLNGSELTVYQYAGFTIGAGSSCPPLDSFWVGRTGNSITIDVLYNTLGAWPAQGCLRVDTLVDTINPCSPCQLIVNSHTIQAATGVLDTFWNEQRDTSYFTYLSSSRYRVEDDLEVYPNPASEFVYLSGAGLSNAAIRLMDISGREVRFFAGGSRRLDLLGIKAGIYFWIVELENKELLVRKVVIE